MKEEKVNKMIAILKSVEEDKEILISKEEAEFLKIETWDDSSILEEKKENE